MYRRTSRLNHVLLTLVGLVLLAGGAYLVLRHLGRLGARQPAHDHVYDHSEAHWLHDHKWIWLVVAAVVIVIGLIAVRWLLVQVRLDRIRTLRIDRDLHAAGHTRMAADVLTDAIETDVLTYPGVTRVRAVLVGAVDAPEIVLRVQTRPLAELGTAFGRIVSDALPAARTALDAPDLPAQVHVVISGRTATERDERGYRPDETVRELPARSDPATDDRHDD